MTKREAKKIALKAAADMAYEASRSSDIFECNRYTDDEIILLRWELREVSMELDRRASK